METFRCSALVRTEEKPEEDQRETEHLWPLTEKLRHQVIRSLMT